jgi:glycosyltransferase involved in cell wall biosynthesis
MHVLILNQYALPPGSAGITRHADIGRGLTQRGHRVTIVAAEYDYLQRASTGKSGRENIGGVDFRWLACGTYVGNDRRRIKSMITYAIRATITGVRIHPRPDVVIGSSPHLLAGLAGSLIAAWHRVPFVLEVRDIWPAVLVDLGAVARGSMIHRILSAVERSLYQMAHRIVMVPPNGHLRVAEVGVSESKCVHIPNAAAAPENAAIGIDRNMTALIPLDHGDFVITYTGKHGVSDGLFNVLEAVEALRSRDPATYRRTQVLLVGDGLQRASLQREAQERGLDRVHVLGPVGKDRIPDVLGASDACLMHAAPASILRYGLSPNKLFDYFAAGKPVLISSDYPTLVDEARAGIRFQPGDPVALANAIVAMVNTPGSERARMGQRGRRLVETEYSIETVANRYESVLAASVAEGRH